MNDFRRTLYRQYVSTLKRGQLSRDPDRVARFFGTYRHRFLPLLGEAGRGEPILELGCGPGYLLEFLRDQGFTNARGIDISAEQIKLATAEGLKAEVADVFDFLRRKRNAYQVIFAIDFLEHFTKQELLRLFPLIHRALRKGGLLIIQTPNGQGLFPGQVIHGDLTHCTILAEDSLRQLLLLHGFGDIQFRETRPLPESFGGRLNLVLWKIIRAAVRIVRQIEANNASKIWTENMIAWGKKT